MKLERLWAMIRKEFVQMRRDRITFGMMIGVPLLQLVLFGFAINSDPKHLPAALVMGEDSIFARSIVSAVERTDDGWRVEVELVELERAPATTNILATYEVEMDDDCSLVAYRRLRRYYRNAAEEA